MSLTWQTGIFEIAIGGWPGESAESAAARWESGDRETKDVEGLVAGPFGVHRDPFGAWTLTARSCGFRIAAASSLQKILRLAEGLPDLDWTGTPTEIGERNAAAVNAALQEASP